MNLINGLKKELERNIELRQRYFELGTTGEFGLINQKIKTAQIYISRGDLVGMTHSYEELKKSD